jgi:hypothetical protein
MRTESRTPKTVRLWNQKVQGRWSIEGSPCKETEAGSGWWQSRELQIEGAELRQVLDLFEDANCSQASLQLVFQRTLMEPDQGMLLHTLETQSSDRSLEIKRQALVPLLNQGDVCQIKDFTLQISRSLNQACGKPKLFSLNLKLSKSLTLELQDEPSFTSLIQPPSQSDTLFLGFHRSRSPGEEEWPLLERITGPQVNLPGGSTWLKFKRMPPVYPTSPTNEKPSD